MQKLIINKAKEVGYDKFSIAYNKDYKIEAEVWFLELCRVQQWLRSKNIHVEVFYASKPELYMYDLRYNKKLTKTDRKFKTFIESLQDGISVGLNLIEL